MAPHPGELTYLSACPGIGGLDLAFHRVFPSARPVAYVEGEAFAVELLAEKMREGTMAQAPIWDDLSSFPAHRFRGTSGLVGGIPCQPHSQAGLGLGADDPRDLWPVTRRLLRDLGCSFLLLENVAGFASGGEPYLGRVLGDLSGDGFDAEWSPVSAAEVGATHRRERIFILAYRHGFQWSAACRQSNTRHDGRHDAGGGGEGPLPHPDCRPVWMQRGGGEPRPEASLAGSAGQSWPAPNPPGPDDYEAWGEVLRKDPHLEPALCRVAHGLPSKLDRLRGLGNAVHSLQGEHAIRGLLERIRKDSP